MKMVLKTAVAAVAVIGFVGAAQAQSVHHSSQTDYSNSFISQLDPIFGTGEADNFWNAMQNGATGEISINGHDSGTITKNNSGSRYHQVFAASENTETASTTAGGTFTLTGTVDKDCSFYNGNGGSAHTINLGTIGVRTGDGDNVSIAFNQVQDASANVNTATAGCNFNNRVTITKAHKGLENNTTSSYDPQEFTTEIPYAVDATWTGVAQGSQTRGQRELVVDANTTGAKFLDNGAWRSAFNMNIAIPAQSKGLVAGTYTDTVTVTLAAS